MTRSIKNDARGAPESLDFTGRLETLQTGVMRGLANLIFAIQAPINAAQEAEWSRYQNDFFGAYTNASTYQARKILKGLEYFRTAVSQGIHPTDNPLAVIDGKWDPLRISN